MSCESVSKTVWAMLLLGCCHWKTALAGPEVNPCHSMYSSGSPCNLDVGFWATGTTSKHVVIESSYHPWSIVDVPKWCNIFSPDSSCVVAVLPGDAPECARQASPGSPPTRGEGRTSTIQGHQRDVVCISHADSLLCGEILSVL